MTRDEWEIEHGDDEFCAAAALPCRCCLHGKADVILARLAERTPDTKCPFCGHALWSHDYIRRAAAKFAKEKATRCKGEDNAP